MWTEQGNKRSFISHVRGTEGFIKLKEGSIQSLTIASVTATSFILICFLIWNFYIKRKYTMVESTWALETVRVRIKSRLGFRNPCKLTNPPDFQFLYLKNEDDNISHIFWGLNICKVYVKYMGVPKMPSACDIHHQISTYDLC